MFHSFFMSVVLVASAGTGGTGGPGRVQAPEKPGPDLSLSDESGCSPVSFKKQMGFARNQFDLSWCYAFASADLLSQAMQEDYGGKGEQRRSSMKVADVSAIQLAHEHQRLRNEMSRVSRGQRRSQSLISSQDKGGFVSKTLASALESNRICLEEDLGTEWGQGSRSLRRMDTEYRRRLELMNAPGTLVLPDTEQRDISERTVAQACRRPFPYSRNELVEISSDKSPEGGNQIMRAINYALNNKRAAAISYHNFLVPNGGNHASTIVGRELRNGKCMYQLRNTWGPTCSGPYLEPHKTNCHEGHIWVSEKDLVANVFAVDYIRPRVTPGQPARSMAGVR